MVFADGNIETEIVRAPFDPARMELRCRAGGGLQRIVQLREQKLSPDGQWLLFTNEDLPQQIHLVRSDGSGYRQLTATGDRNRQGEFSPERRLDRLPDHARRLESRGDPPRRRRLAVSPGRRGISTPRWSPDGSTIAVFDNNKEVH